MAMTDRATTGQDQLRHGRLRRAAGRLGLALMLLAALLAVTAAGRGPRGALAQTGTNAPEARSDPSVAYDAAMGMVLLFGGTNLTCNQITFTCTGAPFNDTWSWNGSVWTPLSPATSPEARSGAGMAYDGSHLILFGGLDNNDNYHNDTWSWDGSAWTQVAASGDAGCTTSCTGSPQGRFDASMAYDGSRVILFGGYGFGGQYLGDTWSWNGSAWTQLSPATSPPAGEGASMAYDGSHLILFGGCIAYNCPVNSTWSWNGSTWAQLSPATSPPGRYDASMAYDGSRLILFGGVSGNGSYFNDTWSWNGSAWTQLFPAASPPARSLAGMAYDPAKGTVLLFGGQDNSGFLNDTWSWNGSAWIQPCGVSTNPASSPCVFAVTPNAGAVAGGTSVTVSGTGFTGATAVTFGATSASSFNVQSDTTLTATAPPGTSGTTVDLRVTTPAGTSAISSADEFTYVGPPTVSGVSPNSGPVGGGTTVTITGTNFSTAAGQTLVHFGGIEAQLAGPQMAGASGAVPLPGDADTSCPKTTLCYAISPPGPAGAGTVNLTVTTSFGTSATSSADQFTFLEAPSVSSISPTTGVPAGGTTVTINGSNFSTTPGATSVNFGANAAPYVSCASSSRCTATSPAGAGTVHITVSVGGQSSTTSPSDQFSYAAGPSVTGLSPRAGSTTGGTSVSISGSGFTGATAVKYGSVNATSFTVNSDTSISATAPAGSAGTVVDVTVTTAVATSGTSAADSFIFLSTGDVNADGHVTAVDALCVLRAVVGLPGVLNCPQPLPGNPIIATNETTANSPTSVDALCILRGVVGLPATSVCPELGAGTSAASVAAGAIHRAPTGVISSAPSLEEGEGSRPGASANAEQPDSGLIVLVPASKAESAGRATTISVQARLGTPSLGSWSIDLSYDPRTIKITGCKAADGSVCNTDAAPGVVRIAGASATGLSGTQAFAEISFSGTGRSGPGALMLTAVTLTDAAGQPLAAPGSGQ